MKKKIILFMVLIICVLTVNVFASSFTIKISIKSSTSTSVELGKTISLLVNFTNISGDGVGAVVGKLEYDKAVFEKVASTDIKASSGWNSVAYNDIEGNAMEGSFATERSSGDIINTDNELMEITLKVKDNATIGSTVVKITRNKCIRW